MHRPYVELAVGLALLYLALFAITASVSRGLRRQLALNARQAERLRVSEEQHRLLFERNPQPLIAYDLETPRMGAATWLRCEVTDTGIGMDGAIVERMFEPFTQADSTATRSHGGTGLGLAIARELIELMGGVIGARSAPGRGSTFWFELELEPPSTARVAAPPRPAREPRGGEARSVLVVEDSPVNQLLAVRCLERCGFRAEAVASGEAALATLARRRYAAVLMDCLMPGLDGFKTTGRLREREPDGRRTPVIGMTPSVSAAERERRRAAGMDDCIAKPMRVAELATLLARWMGREGTHATAPALAGAPMREPAAAGPAAGTRHRPLRAPRRGRPAGPDPRTRRTTSRGRAPRHSPRARARRSHGRR